jgi:hypothetical protein
MTEEAWGALKIMLSLTKEQEAAFGLELATKRQEHSDLNAAIDTLTASNVADRMLIQRLKKRKLALKDRIVQLENILLPDIIA